MKYQYIYNPYLIIQTLLEENMIRTLKISDYETVYELWQSTQGMGLRSLDDTREGIGKFIDRNPSTNFVAIEDGIIVGVIMSGHDGRRGYIYHAVVLPKYRKKKIGKLLVDHVINALKAENINKICLVVFKNNPVGNDFWAGIGFEERTDLLYRNMSINALNL